MDTQKAVAIAKDVIAQIKLQQYIANSGSYFYDINSPDYAYVKVKNILDKKCKVCALGACIVSAARLFNQDTYEAVPVFNSINENLKEYFDPNDLLLMEYTFERGMLGELYNYSNDTYEKYYNTFDQATKNAACFYGDAYSNVEDRLIAIMRNIIRNKGRFIIPKKYVREAGK